jgi:hypothetical protein
LPPLPPPVETNIKPTLSEGIEMEKATRALYDVLSETEVLENDELRVMVSNVIIQLNQIIASRKKIKKEERPSSPCPCGTCED